MSNIIGPIPRTDWNTLIKLSHSIKDMSSDKEASPKRLDREKFRREILLDKYLKAA